MNGRRQLSSALFFQILITLSFSCSEDQKKNAGVVVYPEAQNVSSGERAVFRCGGIGSILTWLLNGTALNMQLTEEMNISYSETPNTENCTIQSTISILGGNISNNTRISCLVSASGIHNSQSYPVLLRVQGPPGSVGNLVVKQVDSVLSWTAPYSLNGVDTFYNVSVTDESNEGGQMLVKTVLDTSCYVELINCHSYSFSVVPWNNAGSGAAKSLEYLFPGAPVSPPAENITVTGLALNTYSGLVTATLQYPVTSNCYSYQNITVEASSMSDNEAETVFSSVSQVDDSIVTVAIDGMPLNTVLSVNLVLRNVFGTSPVRNGLMLRTYNTQGVTIKRDYGISCFQCTFLHNSQTTGCYLSLKPVLSQSNACSSVQNISIPRNNCLASETCVRGLYQGTYNIEVYDLYNSSNSSHSHSDQPQILTNIEISGASCTVSTNIEGTATRHLTTTTMVSARITPFISVGPTERNVGNVHTAGVLIGVFGGILGIILLVMIVIFIYRKRQVKGGSLRINQSSAGVEDPTVTRATTIQGDMSQMPSFSSLGPPPYQPPPQITRDENLKEQYVLMLSASTRSPSASNSTSSHLGLVQGNSSKDLTAVSNRHYDHLYFNTVEVEDIPKKYPLNHLMRASDTNRFSFELKPPYRNEHLV